MISSGGASRPLGGSGSPGDYAAIIFPPDSRHDLIDGAEPDIVFYNAGVDPFSGDKLGRLALSHEGLRLRDEHVIRTVRRLGLPLAGVLGGGYSTDIDELAGRHLTLLRAAAAVARETSVLSA